jgi:hypothetical protein
MRTKVEHAVALVFPSVKLSSEKSHLLEYLACFYTTFEDPKLIVFLTPEIPTLAIACDFLFFTALSWQRLIPAREVHRFYLNLSGL